jgi:hypothetical protein
MTDTPHDRTQKLENAGRLAKWTAPRLVDIDHDVSRVRSFVGPLTDTLNPFTDPTTS